MYVAIYKYILYIYVYIYIYILYIYYRRQTKIVYSGDFIYIHRHSYIIHIKQKEKHVLHTVKVII